jgi:hypothetical protein
VGNSSRLILLAEKNTSLFVDETKVVPLAKKKEGELKNEGE